MRLLVGMILGAVLTVGAAYLHDTAGRGPLTAAQPMVNWDVVGRNWDGLRASLREVGDRLHEEWVKRSG